MRNFVVVALFFFSVAAMASTEAIQQAIQLHPYAQVAEKQIDEDLLKQMEQRVAFAKVKLENTEYEISEVERTAKQLVTSIDRIQSELKTLQLLPQKAQEGRKSEYNRLQEQLAYQQKMLELANTRASLLKETYQFNEAQLISEKHWFEQLTRTYYEKEIEKEEQELSELLQRLNDEQTYWLKELNLLNKQMAVLPETTGQALVNELEGKVLEAEERSYLSHLELLIAQQTFQLRSIARAIYVNQSIAVLNHQRQVLNNVEERLKENLQFVQAKLILLESQYQFAEPKNLKTLLPGLIKVYQTTLNRLVVLQENLTSIKTRTQTLLNDSLSRRQGLPGLNIKDWKEFGSNLLSLPGLLAQTVKNMLEQIVERLKSFSAGYLFFVGFVITLLLLLAKISQHYLIQWLVKAREKQRSLTENLLFILGEIVQRNQIGLLVVTVWTLIVLLSGSSLKLFTVLYSLFFVYFAFRVISNLARLFLIESVGNFQGKDVNLYFHLRWTLLVGGILAGLLVLAEHLPVIYQVKEFFNRLLMFFLLALAVILFKAIDLIPLLFASQAEKHPYIKGVLRIVSYLAPLVPLSTAIIGLLGYIQLAWRIGIYQLQFLIVLVSFLLLRGVLVEFIDWLSLQFIRRISNGWLWREAFLKPIDKILQIVLLIVSGTWLFALYGWTSETPFIKEVTRIFTFPVIDLAGNDISLFTFLQIVLGIIVLFWVGRWSREFAYRWIYARTSDLGVRNSLAVFTQYTVVILSIYIFLKLIGLDLTGLAFIAAGLAVGVGFGLRDLANNYVSGVLLLIERPIRKGDFVTINDKEGIITHIGARSMILETWDKTEVIVPNSEAFSKPFINWTLQNTLMRTVLPLRIQRVDNPHQVQAIVLDELKKIEHIVEDPVPQVFMMNINEVLLEFEIRYFINLSDCPPRSQVRSEVLFAIWDKFKEMGIKAPTPQQEVYVKSLPSADGG